MIAVEAPGLEERRMARLRLDPNQMTVGLLRNESGTAEQGSDRYARSSAERVLPRFSRALPTTTRAGPRDPEILQENGLKKVRSR